MSKIELKPIKRIQIIDIENGDVLVRCFNAKKDKFCSIGILHSGCNQLTDAYENKVFCETLPNIDYCLLYFAKYGSYDCNRYIVNIEECSLEKIELLHSFSSMINNCTLRIKIWKSDKGSLFVVGHDFTDHLILLKKITEDDLSVTKNRITIQGEEYIVSNY